MLLGLAFHGSLSFWLLGLALTKKPVDQRHSLLLANGYPNEHFLDRKLKSLHDLTTDVSRHYLINALEESFNQTTLSLVESLTREEYQSVIKRILELGHTSGADFLAGFARSIHCFQQKRNEE